MPICRILSAFGSACAGSDIECLAAEACKADATELCADSDPTDTGAVLACLRWMIFIIKKALHAVMRHSPGRYTETSVQAAISCPVALCSMGAFMQSCHLSVRNKEQCFV